MVVKAEANEHGVNRRYVVTNRWGAEMYPEATYEEYILRGESENRNKELKVGRAGDRLSNHRFRANYFRLYLHCAALNLLIRLRQCVALPTVEATEGPRPVATAERRRGHNARRRRDPLGEGQPETWQRLLIKAAAEVLVRSRRIVVRLSSLWPYREFYQRVCAAVLG